MQSTEKGEGDTASFSQLQHACAATPKEHLLFIMSGSLFHQKSLQTVQGKTVPEAL